MALISSAANPIYRRLRKLADAPRTGRSSERALAEGVHLLDAALTAGVRIETLLLRAGPRSPDVARLAAAAKDRGGRIIELTATLYERIAGVEDGAGILAELIAVRAEVPQRLAADAVYLDGVQDPGNVGTILRTAAAAGVHHVAAGPTTAALWSPKVMRSAMGAHFALKLYEGASARQVIDAFAAEVLAADAQGGDDLYGSSWGRGPTLWMFGAEGQGLSREARSCASRRLRIPVAAGVESLNVAAAAAVCLFEQRRRRMASG